MRGQVHDARVYFRINSAILGTAEKQARELGMSLAEFLRHAVRRQLKEAA